MSKKLTPYEQAQLAEKEAFEQFDALRNEQRGLNQEADRLAKQGDAAALIKLRHRGDDLPELMLVAEQTYLQRKIERLNFELDAMKPKVDVAIGDRAEKHAAMVAAEEAFREADHRTYIARTEYRGKNDEIKAAFDALSRMLANYRRRASAPVVRSLPHAPQSR